jgi:transcriptional regulator with XRE-family HTH domain
MAARSKSANPSARADKRSPARASRPSKARPSLVDIAQQVRSWTDSALGVAGAAADVTLGAAKMMLPKPEQRAALERSGKVLRRLRETAGLSVDEVGRAIDLKDPALLELVENGKVALPFEVILRLASVLGRNDPISFVMRFTRSNNPDAWKTLESLGIGRLAVQAGREREFANIYRANDAARRLSDEEFAELLKFMQSAFSLALALRPGKRTSARER